MESPKQMYTMAPRRYKASECVSITSARYSRCYSLEFSFIHYIVSFLAQVFARRALGKINELAKLENMSSFPSSPETKRAFKEATIKVWVKLNFVMYFC